MERRLAPVRGLSCVCSETSIYFTFSYFTELEVSVKKFHSGWALVGKMQRLLVAGERGFWGEGGDSLECFTPKKN